MRKTTTKQRVARETFACIHGHSVSLSMEYTLEVLHIRMHCDAAAIGDSHICPTVVSGRDRVLSRTCWALPSACCWLLPVSEPMVSLTWPTAESLAPSSQPFAWAVSCSALPSARFALPAA
jgi:hypothetical protein